MRAQLVVTMVVTLTLSHIAMSQCPNTLQCETNETFTLYSEHVVTRTDVIELQPNYYVTWEHAQLKGQHFTDLGTKIAIHN